MDRIHKKTSKIIAGCLLALSASGAYCGAMGPEAIAAPGKLYAGAFGGWAGLNRTDINQYGTAYIPDTNGGPLAVDASGRSNTSSSGVIGGHIGFAWTNIIGTHLPITPALELEGYYMGGAKIQGHDIGNNTVRLEEHDFFVTYPLKTGVFLVNAVLNTNDSFFGRFKPYVGVGIGAAVMSVSGATSIQLAPPEAVNHYNSNPDDKAVTFAAQPKIGFHVDVTSGVSFFAEYRFLYLAQTNLTFGSTVTPGHVATSTWLATIKPQNYNMATIGIDFDV